MMASTDIQPQEYLDRIRFSGRPKIDLDFLSRLQQAHLHNVPFENLSIHSRERIRLEPSWLLEKIVRRTRGGFCFECNGAFGWLLAALGFDVQRLSARVYNEQRGSYSEPFDHMLLLVNLGARYIVDVGFGESFRQPLQLDERADQAQPWGKYRLMAGEDQYIYQRWVEGGWRPQYTFTVAPHPLDAFSGMCKFHQTSPESPFTRNWAASLATQKGRITLVEENRDARLITTENGRRHETIIMGLENSLLLLDEMFDLRGFRLDRR
jgi:N-hydroxyarylamine O-acetyltransferase